MRNSQGCLDGVFVRRAKIPLGTDRTCVRPFGPSIYLWDTLVTSGFDGSVVSCKFAHHFARTQYVAYR